MHAFITFLCWVLFVSLGDSSQSQYSSLEQLLPLDYSCFSSKVCSSKVDASRAVHMKLSQSLMRSIKLFQALLVACILQNISSQCNNGVILHMRDQMQFIIKSLGKYFDNLVPIYTHGLHVNFPAYHHLPNLKQKQLMKYIKKPILDQHTYIIMNTYLLIIIELIVHTMIKIHVVLSTNPLQKAFTIK